MKVFKFELEMGGVTRLDLPFGAQFLAVQAQRDKLWLWAFVDIRQKINPRAILVLGTGQEFTGQLSGHGHIGTVQLLGGDIVLHAFEIKP